MGGTAIAATGGNFILGHANRAGQPTSLKNTGTGPALRLANGHAGSAPFTINGNTHVVPGLNANYLGGHPSSYYASRAVLPSGQSESGMFGAGSGAENVTTTQGWIADAITYPRPLGAKISDSNVIEVNGVGPVTHCPGPGHAAPGFLCFYDAIKSSIGQASVWSDDSGTGWPTPSIGMVMYWQPTALDAYVGGEWTVTAP